jgi:hypothetical protein
MTLFQIIEAIWQGHVVVITGNNFAGVAEVSGVRVAEWCNDDPAECWLRRPSGEVANLWQLTSAPEGGVDNTGYGICPGC